MNRRNAAGLLVLAACAAFARAGDDAKRLDVEWRERWKAGDVVTVTLEESQDVEAPMMGAEHSAVSAVYVERCDEADADGRAVKRTVFFKSWRRTKRRKQEKTDESLTGAVVHGDGTTWTRADGAETTDLARDWLKDHFVKRLGDVDPGLETLSPPATMAVGDEWKPDAAAAVAALKKALDDVPLSAEDATLSVKLVSVDGAAPAAVGHFEMKFHFPCGGDAMPGMTVSSDSFEDVARTVVRPLAGGRVGTDHCDINATMKMTAPGRSGGLDVKMRQTIDRKSVAGGEIPADPQAAKPDAPTPPK